MLQVESPSHLTFQVNTIRLSSAPSASSDSPPSSQQGSTSILPPSLTVSDPLYGDVTITSPVLVDLLQCPAVQRLKKVLQHGITGLIGCRPIKEKVVNRYEHSVGVMLLVRRGGGTEEAQAAALLHDVAHTALSHVVDEVWGYVVHEEDKHQYLDTTNVKEILVRHGFDPERVLEEALFPLLEQDAPRLCADRLDYGLRDSIAYQVMTLEEAHRILDGITVWEGRFVCDSKESARLLAERYIESDSLAWSNPVHAYLYSRAAKTIRIATDKKILRKSDLWIGGDADFWYPLRNSPDPDVRQAASFVRSDVVVTDLVEGEERDGDLVVELRARTKTIDPDVVIYDEGGRETGIKLLSELDEDWRVRLAEYKRGKTGFKKYKVVSGQAF